jgi:hypothetical protein
MIPTDNGHKTYDDGDWEQPDAPASGQEAATVCANCGNPLRENAVKGELLGGDHLLFCSHRCWQIYRHSAPASERDIVAHAEFEAGYEAAGAVKIQGVFLESFRALHNKGTQLHPAQITYLFSLVDSLQAELANARLDIAYYKTLIDDKNKSFQTIGAALGLSGKFKDQFGTDQIEQAAKTIMEDREIITDIRNLCMKVQDERDELRAQNANLQAELTATRQQLAAAGAVINATSKALLGVMNLSPIAKNYDENLIKMLTNIKSILDANTPQPAPEASDLRAAVAPFAAAADACDGYDPSMVVRMYLNTSPGSRLVGEFLLSDLRKLAAALKAGE